eukprot:9485504-Pyramimonas_sp.AAC.1
MSLVSVIRGGGHLLLVGDSKQLPPSVISKLTAGLGLCISISDRLHHALMGAGVSGRPAGVLRRGAPAAPGMAELGLLQQHHAQQPGFSCDWST